MIELSPEMQRCFPEPDAFEKVLVKDGDVVRAKEGRRTFRFEFEEKGYFAKVHMGIGWSEVFKNLSQFRLPVTSASNEWRAVSLLEKVGVETVRLVGKGIRGWNPAKVQSFVIMDELREKVELEDFMKEYGGVTGRKRLELKRHLVRKVADVISRLHGAGINHRDLYLCHFHIVDRDWKDWSSDDEVRLPLLDLHRAQRRAKVPFRWLAKDLGALFFSAIDCEITDRDLVAFLKVYLGDDWRDQLRRNASLWTKVVSRARGFYRKHRGEDPKLPGIFRHL